MRLREEEACFACLRAGGGQAPLLTAPLPGAPPPAGYTSGSDTSNGGGGGGGEQLDIDFDRW